MVVFNCIIYSFVFIGHVRNTVLKESLCTIEKTLSTYNYLRILFRFQRFQNQAFLHLFILIGSHHLTGASYQLQVTKNTLHIFLFRTCIENQYICRSSSLIFRGYTNTEILFCNSGFTCVLKVVEECVYCSRPQKQSFLLNKTLLCNNM